MLIPISSHIKAVITARHINKFHVYARYSKEWNNNKPTSTRHFDCAVTAILARGGVGTPQGRCFSVCGTRCESALALFQSHPGSKAWVSFEWADRNDIENENSSKSGRPRQPSSVCHETFCSRSKSIWAESESRHLLAVMHLACEHSWPLNLIPLWYLRNLSVCECEPGLRGCWKYSGLVSIFQEKKDAAWVIRWGII